MAREASLPGAGEEDLQVLVDDAPGEFFAPAPSDLVDTLLAEYRASLERIHAIAQLMQDAGNRGAIGYFLEGNGGSERRYQPALDSLFQLDGAVAKLNATYWQKALQLTDVYEYMPQARRDEWNKALVEMSTPAFEEESVRSTLRDLLAKRTQFFAERIDGVFRGLSGEHVTNRPEGFSKRMILSYVLSYGTVNHSKAGLIADLRSVIAKFMGRDEPRHATASALLAQMRQATGEWHTVDGGALRIRVYKKGTAHLEVHPDMAWRLNQVLAHLYPLAIPAEHRQAGAPPQGLPADAAAPALRGAGPDRLAARSAAPLRQDGVPLRLRRRPQRAGLRGGVPGDGAAGRLAHSRRRVRSTIPSARCCASWSPPAVFRTRRPTSSTPRRIAWRASARSWRRSAQMTRCSSQAPAAAGWPACCRPAASPAWRSRP